MVWPTLMPPVILNDQSVAVARDRGIEPARPPCRLAMRLKKGHYEIRCRPVPQGTFSMNRPVKAENFMPINEIEEIVALSQSLIRFPSTAARPDQIRECADFICAYLAQQDIRFERLEHNGVPSIAALPGADFAPVLLMAHFDVVAAPEPLFTPRVENGRLYGRGSIDDKYAAALSDRKSVV